MLSTTIDEHPVPEDPIDGVAEMELITG